MDYYMIYLLTGIGLTQCGNSKVKFTKQTIYWITRTTNTIHRKTQLPKEYIEQHNRQKQYIAQHNRQKQYIEQHNSLTRKSADRALFASYTLAFALQLRKKHWKT